MNDRVEETVTWAMQEHARRKVERGIGPKDTLQELALIFEIGNEILRRPRPTRWQRIVGWFR